MASMSLNLDIRHNLLDEGNSYEYALLLFLPVIVVCSAASRTVTFRMKHYSGKTLGAQALSSTAALVQDACMQSYTLNDRLPSTMSE